MRRIVLILSSLLLAMAPAASVACQEESLQIDVPSLEVGTPAEVTDGDALIDRLVDDLLSESGFAALIEDSVTAPDTTAIEDATTPACDDTIIPQPDKHQSHDSIRDEKEGWSVARSLAEARDGEIVTDHDRVTITAPDGSITGFAESFAQVSAGEGGYAKAVSSVSISDGGSIGSSVAIAKAD